MEDLKTFLEDWIDPEKRDKEELKRLYSFYMGADLKDCPKCEAKAITDLRKYLHKAEQNEATLNDLYPNKKYVLKPGKHQFVAGDHFISNDTLTDAQAKFYIENYPHTKSLFVKLP